MTHVFVVNETTLKYHLEHLFAGTGAMDFYPDFINSQTSNLNASSEKLLASMLADISRINIGDKVIFYLEGQYKFFGTFKVAEKPFLDDVSPNSYLETQLGRPLPFRVKIEPDTVYAKGISEHDALDSLAGINKPYEMNWSLILRKLKGKRGCTMITDFESTKLIDKIKMLNSNTTLTLNTNSQKLTFDILTKEIKVVNSASQYTGRKMSLNVENRLKTKIQVNTAHEAHLQAYIIQKLRDSNINSIKQILLNPNHLNLWIGNEVSCSVGMQRIDILTIEELSDKYIFNVIELKYVPAEPYIVSEQLPWYIEWLNYYILPLYNNKPIEINPVIIAKQPSARVRRQTYDFNGQTISLSSTLQSNVQLNNIHHIKYDLQNNQIVFM